MYVTWRKHDEHFVHAASTRNFISVEMSHPLQFSWVFPSSFLLYPFLYCPILYYPILFYPTTYYPYRNLSPIPPTHSTFQDQKIPSRILPRILHFPKSTANSNIIIPGGFRSCSVRYVLTILKPTHFLLHSLLFWVYWVALISKTVTHTHTQSLIYTAIDVRQMKENSLDDEFQIEKKSPKLTVGSNCGPTN